MDRFVFRRMRRSEGKAFLKLVDALADYEKLAKPSLAARRRLLADAFGPARRFRAYLAFQGPKAVGYAITVETYSSFLALPTLYLEDIFVLPECRGAGIGLKMFRQLAGEAHTLGCGRMEWVVLDWNTGAQRFYDRLGARRLTSWYTYRLERSQLRRIAGR